MSDEPDPTIQFQIPGHPYSVVKADLGTDVAWVMEHAKVWADALNETFGGHLADAAEGMGATRDPAPPQQPPSAPAQGGSKGSGQQQQGETRAEKFPVLEGWKCDECGGPVGRRAATGNMKNDAAVCLGTCKDGRWAHTVDWLDEQG